MFVGSSLMRKRAAIFISGRGSNMMALVEASKASDFPLDFVLVISNDPDAEGLSWATDRGIQAVAIDHRDFAKDREAHERAIDETLKIHQIEFICLAGYMRILTPYLVNQWAGKMINIHPSLLPKYKGLHTHERALASGDTEAGCSVHWVSSGVDEGDIIAQSYVPIIDGDTAETLATRVLKAEHQLYPKAILKALKALT